MKAMTAKWEGNAYTFKVDLLPDGRGLLQTKIPETHLTDLIFEHPKICTVHDVCKGLGVSLNKRGLKFIKIAEKCSAALAYQNGVQSYLDGLVIVKMHVDVRGFMYNGTRLERYGMNYLVNAATCEEIYLEMWNSNVYPVRIRGKFYSRRPVVVPKRNVQADKTKARPVPPPPPPPLSDDILTVDDAWFIFGITQKRGTFEDVKRQYQTFVFLHHPDRNPDKIEWANAQLIRANLAWALLQKHCKW